MAHCLLDDGDDGFICQIELSLEEVGEEVGGQGGQGLHRDFNGAGMCPEGLCRALKACLIPGAGEEREGLRFDLSALSEATAFRVKVWQQALRIPPGTTITYGELARAVGCSSPRAIGQALGANPLPLAVPCHRVVAAGGGLGGFSAGLEIKALLIEFERQAVGKSASGGP